MPRELPNCNSLRVQRASRLNNIEDGRLHSKIHLMHKDFRRSSRLANQDMRVINLTLEFIQNSSGHSPQGVPPETMVQKGRTTLAPCFMYGERVISRKYRRSLAGGGGPRRDSSSSSSGTSSSSSSGGNSNSDSCVSGYSGTTTSSSSSSSSQLPSRPQSSPVKRRVMSAVCSSRRRPRPRPGTARAAIANINRSLSDLSVVSGDSDTCEQQENKKTLMRRPKSAKMSIRRARGISPESLSPAPAPAPPRPPIRGAFMTQAGDDYSSRSSSAVSARSRPVSAHAHILERVIDLPVTSKIRQTKVIEYKKVLNMDKNKAVQDKLKAFIESLPGRQENDDG